MSRIKQLAICKIIVLIALLLSACDNLYDFDEAGNLVPKTTIEDPLLPSIEINGTKLHAESFGNIHNPIIVFLHGGPGSDYRCYISEIGIENASRYPNERKVNNGGLSRLQSEYFCVFYDQRGAGLSPRFDKGEVTFDLYLKDLDAIINYYLDKKLEETGIKDTQVYIVGHSYGGTLGTGYINRYPEKVKDVAFYEPGPFSQKAYDNFFNHSTSYFAQIGSEWLDEYLLSLDHFSSDSHERYDYQQSLGSCRSQPEFHENNNLPFWRLGCLILGEDLEKQDRDITSNLSAFQGRMLFIGGELSGKEYPDYDQIQMSCYPRSEFRELKGEGHGGPWTKPQEVAEMIKSFFQNK